MRWEIIDAFLKHPYRDYSSAYLSRFKAEQGQEQLADRKLRDSVALKLQPSLPLNAYTGRYFNDLYGNMIISIGGDQDQLQLRFEHHPKMFATAQPLGGNRFYVVFSDPEYGKAVFPFTVQGGRVTNVRVKVADFIEMTPYDFRKVQ